MKLMAISNLLIGDCGVLDMPVETFRQWTSDKIDALCQALSKGKELGVEACIIVGGLFGEGFIPRSVVDETLDELDAHNIPVLYFTQSGEFVYSSLYESLSSRRSVSVFNSSEYDKKTLTVSLGPDDAFTYVVDDNEFQPSHALQSSNFLHIAIQASDSVLTASSENESVEIKLPPLEPQEFSGLQDSGFFIIETNEKGGVSARLVPSCIHPWLIRRVDVSGMTKSSEIIPLYTDSIRSVPTEACLRVEFVGKASISIAFNSRELEARLRKRFFYAEVSNESSISFDSADSESTTSLLGEFERLVLTDNALSDTEKAHILRSGWGALNGKVVAE